MLAQEPIGQWIDRTHSYSQVTFVAGLVPLIGFLAIAALECMTRENVRLEIHESVNELLSPLLYLPLAEVYRGYPWSITVSRPLSERPALEYPT